MNCEALVVWDLFRGLDFQPLCGVTRLLVTYSSVIKVDDFREKPLIHLKRIEQTFHMDISETPTRKLENVHRRYCSIHSQNSNHLSLWTFWNPSTNEKEETEDDPNCFIYLMKKKKKKKSYYSQISSLHHLKNLHEIKIP